MMTINEQSASEDATDNQFNENEGLSEHSVLKHLANFSHAHGSKQGIDDVRGVNGDTAITNVSCLSEAIPSSQQFHQSYSYTDTSTDMADTVKQCANCGAKNTPTWRRCPEGKLLLCNACGLYIKNHKEHRKVVKAPDGQLIVAKRDTVTTSTRRGSKDVKREDTTNGGKGKKSRQDTSACGLRQSVHSIVASKTGAIAWMPCYQCSQLLIVPMVAYLKSSPVLCEGCWAKDEEGKNGKDQACCEE